MVSASSYYGHQNERKASSFQVSSSAAVRAGKMCLYSSFRGSASRYKALFETRENGCRNTGISLHSVRKLSSVSHEFQFIYKLPNFLLVKYYVLVF